MGRPIKQGVDWFRHDTDMRNDPKVKALRRKFGLPGYAVYVMTIETMADSDGFITVENPLNLELTAGDIDIPSETLREILDYCVQVGLFTREPCPSGNDTILSSRRLKLDMQMVIDARNSDREYLRRIKGVENSPKRELSGVIGSYRTKSRVENSKLEEVEPPPLKGAAPTSLQSEPQEKENAVHKSRQPPSLPELEKSALLRQARESKAAGLSLMGIELRALQEVGEAPPESSDKADDFPDDFPEAAG